MPTRFAFGIQKREDMYILFVIISVLLIVLVSSYAAFKSIFGRKRERELYHGLTGDVDGVKRARRELIEKFESYPKEVFYIESFDKTRLHCNYYHTSDTAPTAILLHGYRSMGLRDFSGIADELLSLGFNILLLTQRAHGKSSGRAISFGIKERLDAKAVCEYVDKMQSGKGKIILCGVSMGASTVAMASALSLPESVCGIVCDCPFSSPRNIIRKVISDKGLPAGLIYPFIRLGAVLFGGFDPSSLSVCEEVKSAKIPLLLFHGTEDKLVPISMSEKIFDNYKCKKTFVKVRGATHTTSVIYDRSLYSESLKKFTDEVLR